MKIILEEIDRNLSYTNQDLQPINKKIEINNFEKLKLIFDNSFNYKKTINGFEIFLKNYENNFIANNILPYYFVDHSQYSNLFLVFQDENKLLEYIQDTCEARGETIPKTLEKALIFLKNDETYLFKIITFDINLNEFQKFFREKS